MLQPPLVLTSHMQYNISASLILILEILIGLQHSVLYDTYMLLGTDLSYLVDPKSSSQGGLTQTGAPAQILVDQSLAMLLALVQVWFPGVPKKQPTMATSSTEAEYIVSCHGAKEAVWLCLLLKSLGHAQ